MFLRRYFFPQGRKTQENLERMALTIELYDLLALRERRRQFGLQVFLPDLIDAKKKQHRGHWSFSNGYLRVYPRGLESIRSRWLLFNHLKGAFARHNQKRVLPYYPSFLRRRKMPLPIDGSAHGLDIKLLPESVVRNTVIVLLFKDGNGPLKVLTIDSVHQYVYPDQGSATQKDLPTGNDFETVSKDVCDKFFEIFFADTLFQPGSPTGKILNHSQPDLANLVSFMFERIEAYLDGIDRKQLLIEAVRKGNPFDCLKYVVEKVRAANNNKMNRDANRFLNLCADDLLYAELREKLESLLSLPEFNYSEKKITAISKLPTKEINKRSASNYLKVVLERIVHNSKNATEGAYLCKRLKRLLYEHYCYDLYQEFQSTVLSNMTRRHNVVLHSDPDSTDGSVKIANHYDAMLDLDELATATSLSASKKETSALSAQVTTVDGVFQDEKDYRSSARTLTFASFQNHFPATASVSHQFTTIGQHVYRDALPSIKRLIINQHEPFNANTAPHKSEKELKKIIDFSREHDVLGEYNKLVAELNRIIEKVRATEGRYRNKGLVEVVVPPYETRQERLVTKWLPLKLADQWGIILELFYDVSPSSEEEINIPLINRLDEYRYKQYEAYLGDMLVVLRETVGKCRAHMSDKERKAFPIVKYVQDDDLDQITLVCRKSNMVGAPEQGVFQRMTRVFNFDGVHTEPGRAASVPSTSGY